MSFFPWMFRLARWSPRFFLLWIIVVNLFFITGDYTMQKTLSFMPDKRHFTCEKSAFNVSWRQFIWNPISNFPFWIIPNNFKRCEIAGWVTPNVSASASCVWHESSSNSNSASSYTFDLPLRSLSSTSNSPFLNFWNHSRQLLLLKQLYQMLLQAIDAPHLQISSN